MSIEKNTRENKQKKKFEKSRGLSDISISNVLNFIVSSLTFRVVLIWILKANGQKKKIKKPLYSLESK